MKYLNLKFTHKLQFVPFVIFTASGMRYVQLQDRPITDFPHEVLFLLTSGSKLGMLGIFIEPFVCVVGTLAVALKNLTVLRFN